jgi:hypothetical protein
LWVWVDGLRRRRRDAWVWRLQLLFIFHVDRILKPIHYLIQFLLHVTWSIHDITRFQCGTLKANNTKVIETNLKDVCRLWAWHRGDVHVHHFERRRRAAWVWLLQWLFIFHVDRTLKPIHYLFQFLLQATRSIHDSTRFQCGTLKENNTKIIETNLKDVCRLWTWHWGDIHVDYLKIFLTL